MVCLGDNLIPGSVGESHQVLGQAVLETLLALSRDHVTTGFVESMNLLRGKVHGNLPHVSDNFFNKRFAFTRLECHEVPSTLVGDLDEGIASHVLDTFVCFVHKLEKLVDDRLQELPVSLQEPGILSHNVHDVTRHHGFVVLSTLLLCETKKILDYGYQEALLGFLVHGSRDGTDSPAQRVAVHPRPFGSINLLSQFINHDGLRIDHIQMGQVDQALAYRLVKLDSIAFLDELAHNFTLIVFNNQDLFWADHLLDHDGAKVC